MGSFDCHCPLTKQWCSINLRKGVLRIKAGAAGWEKSERYLYAMPCPQSNSCSHSYYLTWSTRLPWAGAMGPFLSVVSLSNLLNNCPKVLTSLLLLLVLTNRPIGLKESIKRLHQPLDNLTVEVAKHEATWRGQVYDGNWLLALLASGLLSA